MADKMSNIFDSLQEKITSLLQEKASLQTKVRDAEESRDASLREVFKDMIGVLDAFERCETIISEKGWDTGEEGQKVRDRFLNVKKTLFRKLQDKGITEIPLNTGDIVNDNLCSTCDTEPDPSKQDGTILSIEKKGYMFNDVVLRPAEVVIVKN